jgi:hypothetical protein
VSGGCGDGARCCCFVLLWAGVGGAMLGRCVHPAGSCAARPPLLTH